MSWDNWRSQLPALEHSSMMRSLKPTNFGKVISRQIHSFSDARLTGYGQETYPRNTNEKGDIHCAFLMGKVRVAPVKTTTTPRLELTTAAVSVWVGEWLLGSWKSLWKVNSTGQKVQLCWSIYKMWRNFVDMKRTAAIQLMTHHLWKDISYQENIVELLAQVSDRYPILSGHYFPATWTTSLWRI